MKFQVEGMSCGNCVKSIESNVGAMAGVSSVTVSLQEKTVDVVFDEATVSQQQIAETIDSLGFDVK